MPVHERRQHFRIDDHIYFEYKVLEAGNCYSEPELTQDLLKQNGHHYLETLQYFESLDSELAQLTQTLALKDPAVAHFLNVINSKVDYLARNLAIGTKNTLHKVNISLGGMAFKCKERLKEKTNLKLVIYTKPKMVPIIVNCVVVYCQYLSSTCYRIAVQFEGLTTDQEQLLSQHIMLAQGQAHTDS